MQRCTVKTIFKIAIAVVLIVWLATSGRLDFKSLLVLANSPWVLACIVAVALTLIVASERWRLLLRAQNLPMTFWEVFKLSLIGTFFNFAMPGGVGGDIVKGYYIANKHHSAKTASIISVLMDRVIGLYAMIFMSIVALLFFGEKTFQSWKLRTALTGLAALFLVFTFFWIFLLSEKIQKNPRMHELTQKFSQNERFRQVFEACASYRRQKKFFFEAIFLSLISQGFGISFFVFAGYGLGYTQIPILAYFIVAPIGFMLIALPISIAGIGVGQAAFLFLFQVALNKKTQIGPDMMTAYQVLLFGFGVIGAYFYMSIKSQLKK